MAIGLRYNGRFVFLDLLVVPYIDGEGDGDGEDGATDGCGRRGPMVVVSSLFAAAVGNDFGIISVTD